MAQADPDDPLAAYFPQQADDPEETTTAPADPLAAYFPAPEAVPEAAPEEEPGYLGNLARGMGERGATLAGNLPGFAQTAGQNMEDAAGVLDWLPQLGGVVNDEEGLRYLNPKEWQQYNQQGGALILRDLQEAWTSADFGFTSHSEENWETIKNSDSGVLERAQALAAFGIEVGAISLADMAGAVVTPVPYWASRSEEIAQDRAANDGRAGKPSASDLGVGSATAAIITAMERFGAEQVFSAFIKGGSAIKKILRAAVGEAGTEAVQEQMEYGAETLDTKSSLGIDTPEYWAASLERGAQGAVGGGVAGGGMAIPGAILTRGDDAPVPDANEVNTLDFNKDEIDRALFEEANAGLTAAADAAREETAAWENEQLELQTKEYDLQQKTFPTAMHAVVAQRKTSEAGNLWPVQLPTGEWVLRVEGILAPEETEIDVQEVTPHDPSTELPEIEVEEMEVPTEEIEMERGSVYPGRAEEKPEVPTAREWHGATQKEVEEEFGAEVFDNGALAKRAADKIKEQFPQSTVEAALIDGEWKVTTRGRASIARVKKERAAKNLGWRPTDAPIEVDESESIDIDSEPNPTAEGIEVEEIQTSGVAPIPEGIEVEELTAEDITFGRKIYTGKKPPDDEPPPGGSGGVAIETPDDKKSVTETVISGEIAKGRPARKEAQSDLDAIQARLDEMPKDFSADSDPEQIGQVQDLLSQKRDLIDEIDWRVTPEEAKESRAELIEKAHAEGMTFKKYTTISEMRKQLAKKKTDVVKDAVYKRGVDTIAAAEEEGETPTAEYIQGKMGVTQKVARGILARYSEETSGPVEAKALEPKTDPAQSFSDELHELHEPTFDGVRIANSNGNPEDSAHVELTDNLSADRVKIEMIEASRPGNGSGTQALELLTTLADKHGVTLELEPVISETGTDVLGQEELVEWYQKHGFEFAPEEGENLMVRPPDTDTESTGVSHETKDVPDVPGRLGTDTLPDGTEYDLSKSAETQIATTQGTYDKVYEEYFPDIEPGDLLDYGAGKGLSSKAHGFESLEPYPRGWTPTYQDTHKIRRQYDAIIANNILNVLPKHTRRAVLWDMAEKLRDGGRVYINVRSRSDINGTKVIQKKFGDGEILTGRGTYQKGFQRKELINFIQAELGPDYTVESAKFGSIAVIVTKNVSTDQEMTPTTPDEVAAEINTPAVIASQNISESYPEFKGITLSHVPGDDRFGKTMVNYYGDFKGTEGADGDPVDVIWNKNYDPDADTPIYIVNKNDGKGNFEQHKVMGGFDDILDAENGFFDMYPEEELDDLQLIDKGDLQPWMRSKQRTKKPYDQDAFRGQLNKGLSLSKPTPRDKTLTPTELADEHDISEAVWLLSGGSVATTPDGDHMAYALSRGMEAKDEQDIQAITQLQTEGNAIRASFFWSPIDNANVAWLHVHDDQLLTEAQIKMLEAFVKASKKLGKKPRILIGSSPDASNPVVKKTSVAALRREWGARKAKYREQMSAFYDGLADKSAKFAAAAVGRLQKQLLPSPQTDDLITFLRKHGGINVNTSEASGWRGRLSHLNKEYRLPGLDGIEKTDGSGLSLDQAAEIATESDYIREGPHGYDQSLLADALEMAEDGTKVYSDQNQEWMKEQWAAEQERADERWKAEQAADIDYAGALSDDIGFNEVDSEMTRLIAEASAINEIATDEILEIDDDPTVIAKLKELIDENKRAKDARQESRAAATEAAPADSRVEAEAAEDAGTPGARNRSEQPAREPDPRDFEGLEDYPWQQLAEATGAEILEPPSPDIEGARAFVIDVYSDIERTKFVKQVFAVNFFRHRDVETAFLGRKGPYKARIQERDEFIEINKITFGAPDRVNLKKEAMSFVKYLTNQHIHGDVRPERIKASVGEHGVLLNHIKAGNLKKPYRKLVPIERIEGERSAEREKEVSDRETGWLTPKQWQATIEGYRDELMAEPNPDDVVKHWGEEYKKGRTPRDYISHEEGRAQIEAWKKHAKEIGRRNTDNSRRVILSLFDATGEWAQPWIDAGYDVRAIDLKRDDMDIMDIDYGWLRDTGLLDGEGFWGILAACPCQKFTNTNRQDFKNPGPKRKLNEGGADNIGFTHSSVDLVNQTLALIDYLQPRFWALENPIGRIKEITGAPMPRLSFNPSNYGDPYTKGTQLFGNFNANLPTAKVDPRKEFGGQGSKMQAALSSKDELSGGLRSVTPEGFAYAFFMANNDHDNPIHEEIAKDYAATVSDEMRAKDPDLDRKVEMLVTLAMYDGDGYQLTDAENFPNWAIKLIEDVWGAREEDWRIDQGRVISDEELSEMDAELREMLGDAGKTESQTRAEKDFPRKEPADFDFIDEISDLQRYTEETYQDIDPVILEGAVDAINTSLGMLADAGYTFDEIYHVPVSTLPSYLRDPMTAITRVGSSVITAQKGIAAINRGDKRSKNPENIMNRLYRWKHEIEEVTGEELIPDSEWKKHIQEYYPKLAKALDKFKGSDKIEEPKPTYGEIQSDLYESVGREDLVEQSLQDAIDAKDEKRNRKNAPEPELAQSSGDLFANDGQLEPDLFADPVYPSIDMNQVLADSATAPEGTTALADIPLTAEDGDRRVTHNAEWWKNAIDDRIKAINKLRGCA